MQNVLQNVKYLKSITNARICPVIKANAYGLGAQAMCKLLTPECRDFFVFTSEEAIELKKLNSDCNIYPFAGPLCKEDILAFSFFGIIPVINNLWQLELWNKHADNKKYILHLDTGMNRLGMCIEEYKELIARHNTNNIISIISHLSCADDSASDYSAQQYEMFSHMLAMFPTVLPKVSISASAGLLNLSNKYDMDFARPGIALYGGIDNKNLKPVINLSGKIIHINQIKRESPVGYGNSYYAKKGDIIATVPLGYSDGYNRLLSNNAYMYINNHKVSIIGRISMDMITIDITNLPERLRVIGQKVDLINDKITLQNLAKRVGTIPYEILTSVCKGRAKIDYV